MRVTREERAQKTITDLLVGWELYPFSVVCTFAAGDGSGLFAITFFLPTDLVELLGKLDYDNQCDKSGYYILEDNNTIILTGMALMNLYTIDV